MRARAQTFTYRGADGRPTTTPTDPAGSDDGAGPFVDEVFSGRSGPMGFPAIEWVENYKFWDHYQTHPDYFTIDPNAIYRSEVSGSKLAEETISSVYLQGDVAFFSRRLKLVGGLRAEQTNVNAQGPLTSPTRNFQRDANGRMLTNASGSPLLIVPTSNALEVSRLTFIDRGQHAKKEYLRLFPNINASYNVSENFIARVAHYYSIGRPDFNQYAGGLTLPNTEVAPSPTNRITVNNIGIKAWTARTTKVRLEYYFERVGQISVGAFRRDFANFFSTTMANATPEFLALYGLDAGIYDDYDVRTQYNLPSSVRMQGLEFAYKQSLTFLPSWARGVQVFANVTALRALGSEAAEFEGFIPRTYNWGLSLNRENYGLRANWNYRGKQRRAPVAAGRSIAPDTYTWGSKRLYLDVEGQFRLTRHLSLFANLRNLNAAPEDLKVFNPSTPATANFRQRTEFGSLWTFGLKGAF